MKNFEKVRQMSIEELAFAMGCPVDIDDDFEYPSGCQIEHPGTTNPISCINCTKTWLEAEATR